MPRLLLFAEREVIQRVRTEAAGSVELAAGQGTRGTQAFAQAEINIEGTSLSVKQWDKKLKEANWTLGSSDDHHDWVGVRASSGTAITELVDNCGSDHQKIWNAIFDVKLGKTSNDEPVWKGGQNVYRVMVVHIHHAVARTVCRSCRINFADLLVLCAHLQVGLMGGDQLQVLQKWKPAACSFSAGLIVGRHAEAFRRRHQCEERLEREPPEVPVQE